MDEPVRILCVDDEENVLRAVRRLFLDDPYEIVTATSGDSGLQVLRDAAPVQIVVSDYRMPGMNGVEFLREVREQWPDTVRIVLSGYADSDAIVAAINEGRIYKFIPKPWNDVELKTEIANAASWYAMVAQNRRMAADLKQKNEELQVLNDILRERITDKIGTLERENARLHRESALLSSLSLGVLELDCDGWISYYNEKANQLFGWRNKDMQFAKRTEVFSPELNAFIDDVVERGELTGTVPFGDGMVVVRGAAKCPAARETSVTLILAEAENHSGHRDHDAKRMAITT